MITYEQARQHSQYRRIPEHILQGVYGYVDHRIAPGHFLSCVLSNDLFGALGRADKEAGDTLRDLVCFIHNEVSSNCHGDLDKVTRWLFPKPNLLCPDCGAEITEDQPCTNCQ